MDDTTYAAMLRAAAMEALGMVPQVSIAISDHGLAHNQQDFSVASDKTASVHASLPAAAHDGNHFVASPLHPTGHSAVVVHVDECPTDSQHGLVDNAQRDNATGESAVFGRRSLPLDATQAQPTLDVIASSAVSVSESQRPASVYLDIAHETQELDTTAHSAARISTSEQSGDLSDKVHHGTAPETQKPGVAEEYSPPAGIVDAAGRRYEMTRGWTAINSPHEGTAAAGTAHALEDMLTALQNALSVGGERLAGSHHDMPQSPHELKTVRMSKRPASVQVSIAAEVSDEELNASIAAWVSKRVSKKARKKRNKQQKGAIGPVPPCKPGRHALRSGNVYLPDLKGPSEASAHPPTPPRTKDNRLIDATRALTRTAVGRVQKVRSTARAAVDRVRRHRSVHSVEDDGDNTPKIVKIVRMAFRPSSSSSRPASLTAHVLPLERLAKGDIVQIWTDGSGGHTDAGAAFVYREQDGKWRGQQFTLPNESDALVAEMTALHEALQFAQRLCAGK